MPELDWQNRGKISSTPGPDHINRFKGEIAYARQNTKQRCHWY